MSSTLSSTITSSASAPSSSSNTPFFPDPSTVVPPSSTAEPDERNDSDLARSVLEWVFLALAVTLVIGIFVRRLMTLNHEGRPITDFFVRRPRRTPTRTQSRPSNDLPYPFPSRLHSRTQPAGSEHYPYPLANVPDAYAGEALRRDRRIRGANTDALGRRLDGDEADKDELPAYDKYGGPPKYIDMEGGVPMIRLASQEGDATLPESRHDATTSPHIPTNVDVSAERPDGTPTEPAPPRVQEPDASSPPASSPPTVPTVSMPPPSATNMPGQHNSAT